MECIKRRDIQYGEYSPEALISFGKYGFMWKYLNIIFQIPIKRPWRDVRRRVEYLCWQFPHLTFFKQPNELSINWCIRPLLSTERREGEKVKHGMY